MIHLIAILLICSLYVGTYTIQKKLYLGNPLIEKFILFIASTTWLNRIIVFITGLFIFILFSPFNFLLILLIQLKSYGKD